MKKWIVTLSMCLLVAGVTKAQTVLPQSILEGQPKEISLKDFDMVTEAEEPGSQITARTMYDDRTTWRGYPMMGGNATIMPGITISSGNLVADISGYMPIDSGYELAQRFDMLLAYLGTVEGFEYNIGYGYYMYPEGASPTSKNPNIQEAFATLAYPIDRFRPRVTMVYAWPDEDESNRESGALYVGGVDIQINAQCLGFAEIAYNDGLNPFGSANAAESDWSYALGGIMYDIPIAEDLILRPAVYHQIVMEESYAEEDDQTWFSIGVLKKF